MSTRILMVYPEVPVTYWSFKHAIEFTSARAVMPPLGLLTIAAMIPESYNITIVDCNVDPLTDEDIQAADMVMISAMIVQKESMAEVIRRCKAMKKTVVAGGPYATSSHEQIDGVDHFILDEGELTLPAFLADYENGCARHLYRADGKPELDMSPIPRFDLIDHTKYTSIAVQNSRGCPFNCEFCDIIEMFGRKPRYKSPRQFYAELEAVYATGFRESIFIVDDNFIGNKRKAKELLREIVLFQIAHEYPFSFYTEASVDLAGDEELLDLMADAGFSMVFVGIETPDSAILEQSHKTQNTRQDLLTSVDIIQRKGIQVLAGFILGFDNETTDIFDRQIEFIKKASIPHAMIGLMLALPNTQLYRRLEKEGRILSASGGNNTHELEMNFVPTLPQETLVEGYKYVIQTIYKPKEYFRRSLSMLEKMPPSSLAGKEIKPDKLLIFLKSFLVQFFSSYGFVYLNYLVKGFTRYPHHAFNIVELAVKGHHFFTMTREILEVSRCMERMKKSVSAYEKKVLHAATAKKPAGKIYMYRLEMLNRLEKMFCRQRESIRRAVRSCYRESRDYVEQLARKNAGAIR